MTPISIVSHEDANSGALWASCNYFCFCRCWQDSICLGHIPRIETAICFSTSPRCACTTISQWPSLRRNEIRNAFLTDLLLVCLFCTRLQSTLRYGTRLPRGHGRRVGYLSNEQATMLRMFTSSLLGEAGHSDGRHNLAMCERGLSVEPEVTFVQGRGV